MLGLIKKDLLMLKSNYKLFVIIIGCLIFTMINNKENNVEAIMMLLPMLSILVYLSTFSYDEFNNFNAYACTLPNGRSNVIKAKYITSLLLIIVSLLLSTIISICFKYNIHDILFSLLESIISVFLIISVLFPFMIKYGAMNGRIIIFVFVMIVAGIGYLLSNIINIDSVLNFINTLSPILILLIGITITFISYLISKHIYMNKEF